MTELWTPPPQAHRAERADPPLEVVRVKSAIELRPSWFRHPIWRWRLRHLARDIQAQAELEQRRRVAGDPVQRILDDIAIAEEHAILNGTQPMEQPR